MNKRQRIFVAGHNGMVGRAICRALEATNQYQIITRSRQDLDLLRQADVESFFAEEKIDQVYLAAARVGGIFANNSQPAQFIYENLSIQNHIIHSAWKAGVDRLLFLGSSCIYPRHANQPIGESELLTGTLEPTNEAYAIAKIAGIKLCESYYRQYGADFRSVMPTNLYGPYDNFGETSSHVLPALLSRFHQAALADVDSVSVWGSGRPRREFLHVDDMAAACVHVMGLERETIDINTEPQMSHINVGTGEDISIRELAQRIAVVTGFKGELLWDSSKPDGTPRKQLDVGLLHRLGWRHRIAIDDGLESVYRWMLEHHQDLRQLG
ncbi:GDP-L-fucose synthase [Gammaproteobacteria bacterium]|nr:GDP-L-fucose synthase [Gammaproteobacteria bacterium]